MTTKMDEFAARAKGASTTKAKVPHVGSCGQYIGFCAQCGPVKLLDEDGCCFECGADASGAGADRALTAITNMDELTKERDALEQERDKWRDRANGVAGCFDCGVAARDPELSDLKEDRRALGVALAETRQELRSFHEELGGIMGYQPDRLPDRSVLLEKLRQWSYGRLKKERDEARAERDGLQVRVDEFEEDAEKRITSEAEELRAGIEKMIDEGDTEEVWSDLQTLLDDVDARDSLAYLEKKRTRTHRYRDQRDDAKAELRQLKKEHREERDRLREQALEIGNARDEYIHKLKRDVEQLKEENARIMRGREDANGMIQKLTTENGALSVELDDWRTGRGLWSADKGMTPAGMRKWLEEVERERDIRGALLDGVKEECGTGTWSDAAGVIKTIRNERDDLRRQLAIRKDVFGTEDWLKTLATGKYTKWAASLTMEHISGVLWLVGEFTCRPEPTGDGTPADRRAAGALLALRRFGAQPMSVDEVRSYIAQCATEQDPPLKYVTAEGFAIGKLQEQVDSLDGVLTSVVHHLKIGGGARTCAACVHRVDAILWGDGASDDVRYKGCAATAWEHKGVPQGVDNFEHRPGWCPGFSRRLEA